MRAAGRDLMDLKSLLTGPVNLSHILLAAFTGAASWCAVEFAGMYREGDNAAIRDVDNRDLRTQLIRCRDRESDRTDAWLRDLYKDKRGGRE